MILVLTALPLLLAPSADLRFRDVTREAGLVYLQADLSGPAPETHSLSGGAAVGDVDGDGWPDLFVTCLDAPDILFRNLGEGPAGEHLGFADVTSEALPGMPDERSTGAAFADIENDGDLDLFVTSIESFGYRLYVNDGAGVFAEQSEARGASVETEFNHNGTGVAFGDFDRDGYLDFYVSEWRNFLATIVPTHARLYRNLGSANPGHFVNFTQAAGVSIDEVTSPFFTTPAVWSFSPRFADMDDDGWLDLLLTNDFGTSRLFWNEGGTFVDGTDAASVGTDENGMGCAVGDFDMDGDLDWFVTSIFDRGRPEGNWGVTGNRLYRNEGGRTFVDATDRAGVRNGFWGWGSTFFDADHDTDLDLVMTNGFTPAPNGEFADDPMRLWRNGRIGGAAPGAALPATLFTDWTKDAGIEEGRSGKALVSLDYDRDGDLDLFVVHNGSGPVLLRNDGGNRASWLFVELRGSASNSMGIGARIEVRVTPDGPWLVREVHIGSTYLGHDEIAAHFGLGRGTRKVAELRIRWPSGIVQRLENVAANQRLVVEEPRR